MLATYIISGFIVYFLVGAVTSGLLLRWNAVDEHAASLSIIAWPLIWIALPVALLITYIKDGLLWLRNLIAGRK